MSGAPSVFAREDTLFGVCFALGEDFGFNPLYLRILFSLALFWSPFAAVGSYAAAAALVMLSRWLVREPRVAADVEADECGEENARFAEAECQQELPLAA